MKSYFSDHREWISCSFNRRAIWDFILKRVFNIHRVQEEQTLKDEEADRVEGIRRHQHAEEVRQQIREKEKDRIKATNAFFEEGIKLDQEAKARYVCYLKNDCKKYALI